MTTALSRTAVRMTDARTLTAALGGHWHGGYGLAYCPVHENTRTPALSLSDGDGGKLLARSSSGPFDSDFILAKSGGHWT